MPTWTLKIGGSAVDTETKQVSIRRLSVDARATDALDFTETVAHYAGTYNEGMEVILEWPTGTVRFTGRIVERNGVGASGGERVEYRALGWRGLAQNVLVTRSATDSYPERIYNCEDDDIDKPFRAMPAGATVGDILKNLFDTFMTVLVAEGGCSPSATPYSAPELVNLTFVPGKLVLSNLTFDQAITAVLAEQGPAWAGWVDATGVWHFYDRTATATSSLTIGQGVASNQLKRHTRNRFTAVKVVGRRGRGQEVWPAQVGFGNDEFGSPLVGLTASWNPALEPSWNIRLGEGRRDQGIITSVISSNEFQVYDKSWAPGLINWSGGYALFPRHSMTQLYAIDSNTTNTFQLFTNLPDVQSGDPVILFANTQYSDVFRLFQITDAALRDIVIDGTSGMDCCPHVLAVLRNQNNEVVGTQQIQVRLEGDGKFRTLWPMFISPTNGIEAGTSVMHPDFKFRFCYRPTALTTKVLARYPSVGFDGEAFFAPWSVSRELTVPVEEFEDALAFSAYEDLAQEVHKVTSAVGTSGKLVLVGVDWTYVDVRRRINIASDFATTGWELLGSPLTAVVYDFEGNRTELALSEDASSDGINYQQILEQIKARGREAASIVERKRVTDFINCIGESRRRGSSNEARPNELLDAPKAVPRSVADPSYSFPRSGADEASSHKCRCNDLTDPCNTLTQAASKAKNQFICLPDDRHGLTLRHPGGGSGTGPACAASQLAFICAPNSTTTCNWVPGGNYYPFVCQGVHIGDAPDMLSGSCSSGMRDLIVVEPSDLDDDDSGTQIGVGQMLLEFLKAYDSYMQHNEEAHCCLDNRILCLDEGVYGGNDCPNGGTCKTSILKAIEFLHNSLYKLAVCVNAIRYSPGEMSPRCPVPGFVLDFTSCGAC